MIFGWGEPKAPEEVPPTVPAEDATNATAPEVPATPAELPAEEEKKDEMPEVPAEVTPAPDAAPEDKKPEEGAAQEETKTAE